MVVIRMIGSAVRAKTEGSEPVRNAFVCEFEVMDGIRVLRATIRLSDIEDEMRQTVRGLARRDAILVYLGMDALAEGREALEGHDVDRLIEMDGDPVELAARDSRQCENLAGERLVQVTPANMRADEDRRRRLVIGLGSKGGERVP